MVRRMFGWPHFRAPSDGEHLKANQILIKSAWNNFRHTFCWQLARYTWKKSLLLIFSPLGLIVKTLTADDKYSLPNSENMREPIQMQLYKILKTYCRHFVQLVQSTSNFKHFEKKDNPLSVCIFEVSHCERHRYTNI